MTAKAKAALHENERRSHNRKLALRLAQAGIAIFPSLDKTPLPVEWQRLDSTINLEERAQAIAKAIERTGKEPAYVGCTTDPKAIKQLWRDYPDATPSISCGPSGLIVLDCDLPRETNPQNGVVNIKQFFEDNGATFPKDTPVTLTQSGGVHLWYRNDPQHGCASGLFRAMNIQVKGIGGQLVAPDAIREDGKRYVPAPGTPSLTEAFSLDSIPAPPAYVVEAFRTIVAKQNDEITNDDQSTYEQRVDQATLSEYDFLYNVTYDLDGLKAKDPEFAKLMDDPGGDRSTNRFTLAKCLHREFGSAFTVEDYASLLIGDPEQRFGTEGSGSVSGEFDTRDIVRSYLRSRNSNKVADGDKFGSVEDADNDNAKTASHLADNLKADAQEEHRAKVLALVESLLAETDCPIPDPSTLAPFDHRCGKTFTRKFLTMTVAPGGRGKSSLVLQEAVAMVIGRDLTGQRVKRSGVLYINGEDPREMILKRVGAICQHFGIDRAELSTDRLRIVSGRDRDIKLVTRDAKGNFNVSQAQVDMLLAVAERLSVDVVIFDPLVSFHGVPENATVEMDTVAKQFSKIADKANLAVHVVHHVRKGGPGGNGQIESTDSRGASAVTDAARAVRTLNPMTAAEATGLGLPEAERATMIRVGRETDKVNLTAALREPAWMQFQSVALGNASGDSEGDEIGVLVSRRFEYAEECTVDQFRTFVARLANETWAARVQAGDKWAGRMLAEVLGRDADDPGVRTRLTGLLKGWLKAGSIVEKPEMTEGRKERRVLRPGSSETPSNVGVSADFGSVDDE